MPIWPCWNRTNSCNWCKIQPEKSALPTETKWDKSVWLTLISVKGKQVLWFMDIAFDRDLTRVKGSKRFDTNQRYLWHESKSHLTVPLSRTSGVKGVLSLIKILQSKVWQRFDKDGLYHLYAKSKLCVEGDFSCSTRAIVYLGRDFVDYFFVTKMWRNCQIRRQ